MIIGYKDIKRNKYLKWYINIIKKNKKNKIIHEVGYEIHHIIPKSCGGNNTNKNKVKLSFKEHFICHLLLTKIFANIDYHYKMLCAFKYMNTKSKYTEYRTNIIGSKLYDTVNSEYSKILSDMMVKRFKNIDYKNNHILKIKNSWINGKRDKQIEYMKKNSPFKNKIIHDKTMNTRKNNGSNIFITNNPMHNKISIDKKVKKTSGKNHYMRKIMKFYYKYINSDEWIEMIIETNMLDYLNSRNWPKGIYYYINKNKPLKINDNEFIYIKRVRNEN